MQCCGVYIPHVKRESVVGREKAVSCGGMGGEDRKSRAGASLKCGGIWGRDEGEELGMYTAHKPR